MSKAVAKVETHTSEYPILNSDMSRLQNVVQRNLAGGQFNIGDLDRITLPPGGSPVWTINGVMGVQTAQELTGIIIYFKNRRVYWSNPQMQKAERPDCSSPDGIHGVGMPGGSCDECPFSEWGSDPRGGPGQACKAIRQLFMIFPDEYMPRIIVVPPTSLANLQKYFFRLTSRGITYDSVITTLKLEAASNKNGISFSRIIPSAVEELEQEQAERIAEYAALLLPVLDGTPVGAADYPVAS